MKKAANMFLLCAAFCTLVLLNIQSMETNIEEIWKDVVGFEGLYQVSSSGRIKRLHRITNGFNWPSMILSTYHNNVTGYIKVGLKIPKGKQINHSVHRLVAKAFIPNPENKSDVNHINGIKSDNRIENLEWCTESENGKHAFRIGLKKPTRICKLTESDVLFIRSKYIPGKMDGVMIHREFFKHVSYQAIKEVISKRTWAHI